jgi:hypothetical protein
MDPSATLSSSHAINCSGPEPRIRGRKHENNHGRTHIPLRFFPSLEAQVGISNLRRVWKHFCPQKAPPCRSDSNDPVLGWPIASLSGEEENQPNKETPSVVITTTCHLREYSANRKDRSRCFNVTATAICRHVDYPHLYHTFLATFRIHETRTVSQSSGAAPR